MFPIRGVHGQIVAFAGRAADDAREGTPKYLNTPTTNIWHKDHVLYGLAEGSAALLAGGRPVLVEGYLDTIAVAEAGRPGYWGVAPGGTALAAVSDLRVRAPLLVVLDPDAAGRKAAIRDFPLISLYSPAATTPTLPEGADPADIFKKGGPQALAAALAAGEHPFADVAVDAAIEPWRDKLEWPEGQLGAMRAAARLIADGRPADPARQVDRVAGQTGIPFAEVADEVRAALASRPKGQDSSPDQMLRVRDRSLEFPAAPTAATRNGSRRPPHQPGGPGGRHPPRHLSASPDR
jgi:DNA primase